MKLAPGFVRLPIRLHWGLNRITVQLVKPSVAPVGLGDIVLER